MRHPTETEVREAVRKSCKVDTTSRKQPEKALRTPLRHWYPSMVPECEVANLCRQMVSQRLKSTDYKWLSETYDPNLGN